MTPYPDSYPLCPLRHVSLRLGYNLPTLNVLPPAFSSPLCTPCPRIHKCPIVNYAKLTSRAGRKEGPTGRSSQQSTLGKREYEVAGKPPYSPLSPPLLIPDSPGCGKPHGQGESRVHRDKAVLLSVESLFLALIYSSEGRVGVFTTFHGSIHASSPTHLLPLDHVPEQLLFPVLQCLCTCSPYSHVPQCHHIHSPCFYVSLCLCRLNKCPV